MTRAQRIVIVVYCLLVACCCVWVPWHATSVLTEENEDLKQSEKVSKIQDSAMPGSGLEVDHPLCGRIRKHPRQRRGILLGLDGPKQQDPTRLKSRCAYWLQRLSVRPLFYSLENGGLRKTRPSDAASII